MSTNFLNKGQSLIEVIVAVSIFIIIATTGAVAVLGSFSTTRQGKEQTQATFLAREGIEAVDSIRNQSWNFLVNGAHGLSNSSGLWSFSGSSDKDPSGKFSRVVTISDIQRNGDGDVVSSGGTVDPNTKAVRVIVTWNFTPARTNSIEFNSLLTNWQLSSNSVK